MKIVLLKNSYKRFKNATMPDVVESDGKKYTIPEGTVFTNKILIDSSISTENLDSIIGNDNSTGVQVLHLNLYVDYINRSVMPDILNNLLIEQYIYDNQYTTLSRTQARKINYIAITTTSNNKCFC